MTGPAVILQQPGWREVVGMGIVARTWMSDEQVLQRRSTKRLDRWKVGQETTRHLWLDPLFAGALSDIIAEDDDTFWVLMPRIQGKSIKPTPGEQWVRSWEIAKRMIPDVSLAMKTLADLPLPSRSSSPLSPILRAFSAPAEEIIKKSEKIFSNSKWIKRLPSEPDSELVCSHGDPASKNVVLGDRAVLIDWETVFPLPRSADPVHFTAYCLKHASPRVWQDVINTCGNLGMREASGLSEREWQSAALWGALRDFSAFPDRKEDHLRWSEGFALLLG